MKVVHVPFVYFPDPVGGTEVYVAALARALRRFSVESVIAAPAAGRAAQYEHDGAAVIRFGTSPRLGVDALYGGGDPVATAAIEGVLDQVDADILHLHSFTSAASIQAVRAAHRQGRAVVFTYHTPTASCVRGSLLYEGNQPCDGVLDAGRCTSCLLQSRGVPAPARRLLAAGPLHGHPLARRLSGRWGTALRARELVGSQLSAFRALVGEVDAVVAVSGWVHQLLLQAGAPRDRVFLSRHGIDWMPRRSAPERRPSERVRLAFLGRLDPTKGLHLLLDALARRPTLPVSLDVFGVAQDERGRRYAADLARTGARDDRVSLHDPVSADRAVEVVSDYDATVVPSQWLETGPLTVLESFAAGVPVLGSRLGGIAELVSHERDGVLVPYDDVEAWATVLERVATDRAFLERLRAGVRPPRRSADVAQDMTFVYEAALASRPARRPADRVAAVGVG